MKVIDYHRECKRLYKHCNRIFERSGGTCYTTVRKAAKSLRLWESEVVQMAEDLNDRGYLIINVAQGIQGSGHRKLKQADWELEPIEADDID
jgi:Mn-dependent DtxR family transcriptional regulator